MKHIAGSGSGGSSSSMIAISAMFLFLSSSLSLDSLEVSPPVTHSLTNRERCSPFFLWQGLFDDFFLDELFF
jgi:hypothetical protein